jgi:deoxyribonuclease-4
VKAGTRRLADGVALVLEEVDTVAAGEGSVEAAATPRIVLENSAGGGFGLGTSVEELADIDEAIAARGVARDRYAFCLDAAHAWGAGIDVGDPDATDAFLADFDVRIGLDRLVMLHLNDSRSDLGSRTDRHEHLGAGQIGARGLSHLIRHPALAHAVYYLETPGMDEGYDAINLGRARDLAACRPLADLPPEAFLVSSTRARTPPPNGPAA